MQISTEGDLEAGKLAQARVVANVFNGSERSQVQLRVDERGDWVDMKRSMEIDPLYRQLYEREKKVSPEIQPSMSKPSISTHLWTGPLPADLAAGTHVITVRSIDSDGRVVMGRRVVKVR
jgi:hypothetical protein